MKTPTRTGGRTPIGGGSTTPTGARTPTRYTGFGNGDISPIRGPVVSNNRINTVMYRSNMAGGATTPRRSQNRMMTMADHQRDKSPGGAVTPRVDKSPGGAHTPRLSQNQNIMAASAQEGVRRNTEIPNLNLFSVKQPNFNESRISFITESVPQSYYEMNNRTYMDIQAKYDGLQKQIQENVDKDNQRKRDIQMKEKKQSLINIRNVAFLSQLFSLFSNLQYLEVVVQNIDRFTLELKIQMVLYIILLGTQLMELLKFYQIIQKDINEAHPYVDSSTIQKLKDSIQSSDIMISGVLSFAKYLLYLQSNVFSALILVAMPTGLKLFASQGLHHAIGDLSSFVNVESEKERKLKQDKVKAEQAKQENAIREKIRLEKQKQTNKDTLDNLHRQLSDLTTDAASMLQQVQARNSTLLHDKKEFINRHRLIQEHRYNFGMFPVKTIMTSSENFSGVKDKLGNIVPFQVGFESDRVWWGQPSGILKVELGLTEDGIYLVEGDLKSFGRKSVLENDGKIKFTTVEKIIEDIQDRIRSQIANWILNKCRNVNLNAAVNASLKIQEIKQKRQDEDNKKKESMQKRIEEIKRAKGIATNQLRDENGRILEKIHKQLCDLTAYPASMLEKIDESTTPTLFPFKDKIKRHRLIEKHRIHFKEFHIIELFQERKLLIPQTDQQGRIYKYHHNYNAKKYKWGQMVDQLSIDIHLGVHNGKVYLYEGNYQGYGRRTWLNLDGTVKHEHGIFDNYLGRLVKAMELLGPIVKAE